MIRVLSIVALLGLAGCSAVGRANIDTSACAASETSYACQVERYGQVNQ